MTGEPAVAVRTRPSGRVWLVVACAIGVVVFLAAVLPGVFDVKHKTRKYVVTDPIEHIVFVSKGDARLDVAPSNDRKVHIERRSSISRDSKLIERSFVKGKTLTLSSSCTGSRLGVLRRCHFDYLLRVPRKVTLSADMHFGKATISGLRGRLDIEIDAGSISGSSCSEQALFSLKFGGVDYRDTCVPSLIRVKMRAGDVTIDVPAGRYFVHPDDDASRPFENIIEDPESRNEINIDISWAGSIVIKGTRR